MKIRPFLTLTLKIPVRTAFGTVRIGIGFLVRLNRKEWFYILAILVSAYLLVVLLPLIVGLATGICASETSPC